MTTEQAKAIFNKAIAQTKDANQIAKIELAREYFTNPKFRRALGDYVWKLNNEA